MSEKVVVIRPNEMPEVVICGHPYGVIHSEIGFITDRAWIGKELMMVIDDCACLDVKGLDYNLTVPPVGDIRGNIIVCGVEKDSDGDLDYRGLREDELKQVLDVFRKIVKNWRKGKVE